MAMTFDGISSGLPTDQMIKAIMSQESAPLTRLQNRQDKNNLRKNALSSIKSSLMSISTSITSLKSTALNKRTVSSSDSAVATATATGAANGTYDLVVKQLATKARLETTNYMSSSNDLVGMAGDKFTLVGKDGKETKIELTGNTSLAGLNSEINARSKDTGITSSVIQVQPGKFSLVLTSSETGTAGGNGEIGIFAEYNSKLKTSGSVEKLTDSVGKAGDVFTLVDKDGHKTDITLEDGKTSLADLNNAINAKSKDTGISSSVVKLASGEYSLVLATKDGVNAGDIGIFGTFADPAENKLGIAENENDAKTTGLTATTLAENNKLGFDNSFSPGTPDPNDPDNIQIHAGFKTTVGKNAKFTLNGIDLERGSNTFTDAIEGVTLSLNSVSAKTVTLNVNMDKDGIIKIFQDVVNKFNSAFKTYKDATAAGGALERDMSMQAMFTQARSSLSQVILGTDGRPTATSAGIGLKTERDGTLSLDTNALSNALDKDPELVGQVFDKMSKATTTYIDRLTIGGSSVLTTMLNGIDSVNSLLSKQIDTLTTRLTRREEVLKAQFGKMEQLIGQMQSAGQSLGGLSSWG